MTAHAWLIQSVLQILLYSVLLADYWILLVHSCDAQVVVDHLKRYDKDGKGALSRDELQDAIRGAVSDVGCLISGELQTYEVPLRRIE